MYLKQFSRVRMKYVCLLMMLVVGSWVTLNAQKKYAFQHMQMGTSFTLTLWADDSIRAKKDCRKTFHVLDSLNYILSDYLPTSELNALSKTAGKDSMVVVGKHLWTVLQAAHEISHQSKGAFDASIGPLSRRWRKAFRRQEFPDEEELVDLQSCVGYRNIKFYPSTRAIKLQVTRMKLDLGGIAKGYAVDCMKSTLHKLGYQNFLIDGGGDLCAVGKGEDGEGWKVALPNGDSFMLVNQSIATSGKTYKYLEWKGQKYSHIIDPRTGKGVSHDWTVTVIADECMKADAWASALSVMGKEIGKAYEQQNFLKDYQIFFYHANHNN